MPGAHHLVSIVLFVLQFQERLFGELAHHVFEHILRGRRPEQIEFGTLVGVVLSPASLLRSFVRQVATRVP